MQSVAIHSGPAPRENISDTAPEAVTRIRLYKENLARTAREQGRRQVDQGQLDEVFALRPASTTSTPLVLIGGMGPLAGADGFEAACLRFSDQREIVLLQACSILDRTTVLKRLPTVNDCTSPDYADMIDMLECAIAQALKQVRAVDGFIDLIVLCNTCHFFLPAAMKRLADSHPSIAPRLRLTSLIDSAIKAIHRARFMRIMALYTEGTKVSQIYSRPLNQGHRCCVERTDLQPLLSESIYYGVKGFDDEVTVSLGSVIFDDLLNESHQFDCILAGCTEIPLIVDRLKVGGTKRITDFLAKVKIIDPVAEALAAV